MSESRDHAVRTPPGDYADLFEAIPVPATMIDTEGLIVGINQAFLKWTADLGFEVDPAERLGRRLDAFAASEGKAARLRDLISETLAGGDTVSLRESFRDRVGREIHVNVHARSLTGPGHEIVGAIILREDVSKEVHREMRHRLTARVREEVVRMTGSDDMERVLTAVREGLQEVAPQFSNFGVNLVDDRSDPPVVLAHSMTGKGRWMKPAPEDVGEEIVLAIWRRGETAYRADLDVEDEFGEADLIQIDFGERIRSVVDIPFSRGTLAVNSTHPRAFTADDIVTFEALAAVMSDAFTRAEDFQRLEERNRELEQEIAERRQMQSTLRESEERYRELVENMPVAVTHATLDGRIIYQNPFAYKLHGYSEEEVAELGADDLYADPADRVAILKQIRARGQYSYEYRMRHKEGHILWVRGTTRVMRDEDGNAYLHGIAEDITQQRREEALAVARQRLRDEVWSMHRQDDIESVLTTLRSCLELLEVPALGCSIHIVDVSTDPPTVNTLRNHLGEIEWQRSPSERQTQAVLELWRAGVPVNRQDVASEDRFHERDYVSEIWGFPVRSILDVPYSHGTVGVNNTAAGAFGERDIEALVELAQVLSEGFSRIQDLKNLERRLEELEREMAERRQLEVQLRHAQKMEAVGELTAGLAHNFNNILQTVIGSVSMAMVQAPSGVSELLEDAASSAHRAAEMIRHLLVFSRRGIQPQHRSLDLQALLTGAVDVVSRTFDRRIGIDISIGDEAIHVMGDEGQLEQVFLNLCLNSRDAVEAGKTEDPRITVSLERAHVAESDLPSSVDCRPGSHARISVSDNGAGMDAATVERVFEPFFTTKRADRGTGLGLSTAYGIVQQHGGWIECSSEPNRGTTFVVHIPVTEAPAPARHVVDSGDPARGTERVLVIDDEEMVRRTTRRMLEHYGYDVLDGDGGPHGLEVFAESHSGIDLVLLDLSMPVKSGLEVLDEMREIDAAVKVVFFTGYSADQTAAGQVDGVLQKPFGPADLASEVRAVLDLPPSRRQPGVRT